MGYICSVFWSAILAAAIIAGVQTIIFAIFEENWSPQWNSTRMEEEMINRIEKLEKNYQSRFEKIASGVTSMNSTLNLMYQRIEKLEERSSKSQLNLHNKYEDLGSRLLKTMNSTLSVTNQKIEKLEGERSKLQMLHAITALVDRPVARLFSGTNFTGNMEDYSFETSNNGGGCHDLQKLRGNVRSVSTFGKCVRVFLSDRCSGWSLALYPGSLNSHNILNTKLKEIQSIGPCLKAEFKNAHFTAITGDVRKNHSENFLLGFPDLIEFLSYRLAQYIAYSQFSLDYYELGRNNRVEVLRAKVYYKHLNIFQPSFNMENTAFFRSLEKLEGDVPGYAIPLSIGGPINQSYNVFPQSHSAKEELEALATKVRLYLRENSGSWVILSLNFQYENSGKTRPYAFYFWLRYGVSDKVEYGRVDN